MITTGTVLSDDGFDIVKTYNGLLKEDPELTMPVAAIESLVLALSHTPASTVSETLDLLSTLTTQLKRSITNPISLSAGTDLFQRYLITTLTRPGQGARGDFDQIRTHLIRNGQLFVERAKEARERIASFGRHFVGDGAVVLTNGGSRVVGALLRRAAETCEGMHSGGGTIRFKVLYVTASGTSDDSEAKETISALRARDIPVATIPPTAIAYSLSMVTLCLVGAEGVVENGGIINRLGTYQMGMLAKSAGKPFYVLAESHKFVRLYPLGQDDLGFQQTVVNFSTQCGQKDEQDSHPSDGGVADLESKRSSHSGGPAVPSRFDESVDYTPPHLISGIITESGVLTPSAVSEELIKIWF
ncbi:translation initiation factor eIF-2B subunit alpha [Elasticomyces elasticus]|nr:translation initiation factor eIF-2B subunit alpha [Elasticomyces elasticus]